MVDKWLWKLRILAPQEYKFCHFCSKKVALWTFWNWKLFSRSLGIYFRILNASFFMYFQHHRLKNNPVLHRPVHAPLFLVNRVEHQNEAKRPEQERGGRWVCFGVQLGLRQKQALINIYTKHWSQCSTKCSDLWSQSSTECSELRVRCASLTSVMV